MKISKNQVVHIAKLANLDLTPAEITKFQKQLGQIIKFVSQLNQVKTPARSQVKRTQFVARDDNPSPSLSADVALKNSASTDNDFFKVAKIFDDASALAQHHSESTEE